MAVRTVTPTVEIIDRFTAEHRWLSNFWEREASISAWGMMVPSVEHAYQAAKAELHHERRMILAAPSPAKAKRMGRTVQLRSDWEEVKETVMHTLLRRKFATLLGVHLLATGDTILIEGNTWGDTYWGAVPADSDNIPIEHDLRPAEGWRGLNRLGELLMQVRSELFKLRGL